MAVEIDAKVATVPLDFDLVSKHYSKMRVAAENLSTYRQYNEW